MMAKIFMTWSVITILTLVVVSFSDKEKHYGAYKIIAYLFTFEMLVALPVMFLIFIWS